MSKLSTFLLSLTIAGTATATAQQKSNTSFKPSEILKDTLTYIVAYDLDNRILDSAVQLYGAVYSYQDYEWKVSRFPMNKKSGLHYEGTARVPAAAAISYARFYQGDFIYPDAVDNNRDKGYLLPVSGIRAGYYLGQLSLHKNPVYSELHSSFATGNADAAARDSLVLLLSKEWKLPGADTLKVAAAYFNYLRLQDSTRYNDQVQLLVKRWAQSPSITDDQLLQLYLYASSNLHDQALSDWLDTINAKRFPAGALRRLEAAQSNHKAKSQDYIRNYQEFLSRFPYAQWRVHPNYQEFLYYEAHRGLAAALFDKKDLPAFYALTKDLDFKTLNEIYRWNITRAFVFKTLGIDTLRQAAAYLIDRIVSRVDDGSMSSNGFMPLDYANENAHKQLNERLTTQIQLLNSIGRYDQVRHYYSFVFGNARYSSPELNEAYFQTLTHLAGDREQQSYIEKCVYADALTAVMMDRLKELYKIDHQGMEGFDTYYTGLKSALSIQKIHEEVRKNLVQMDFEPFAMESSKGDIVRSSDWEDKIVVLDFWATWCKPCIGSFPSMQKIVDQYQADPGVQFYFVGTMQSGDYKQKDSNYIKSKGFRFNLLYDGVNAQTGDQSVVFSKLTPMFHSSGIPRKVIIKDGVIRYTTEGFGGSTSNLIEELSYAITLLKNEDNKTR